MTTLAEMTPEQRAETVGLWADAHGQTWVIFKVYGETCTLIDPDYGFSSMLNKNVTPRFDLARAWTPDGKPVAGEWEIGYSELGAPNPDGAGAEMIVTTKDGQEIGNTGTPTGRVRRYRTEWEKRA